jgi:hypothetical protein
LDESGCEYATDDEDPGPVSSEASLDEANDAAVNTDTELCREVLGEGAGDGGAADDPEECIAIRCTSGDEARERRGASGDGACEPGRPKIPSRSRTAATVDTC